jgi:hypothetical protein
MVLLSLFGVSVNWASVSSLSKIDFIPDENNGVSRMTLSATGLGVGVANPAEALDVAGDAIISGNLSAGNINLNGAFYHKVSTLTSDANLDLASLIYSKPTSNATFNLPAAQSCSGRQVTIKHISEHPLKITSSSNIDGSPHDLFLARSDHIEPFISLISGPQGWWLSSQSTQGVSQIDTASIAANVWAWYKFDESSGSVASDSSGAGRDASYVNLASGNIGFISKFNRGVFTDGSDDHVQTPTSNLSTNTMSITAWVYLKSYNGTRGLVMASSGSTKSGLHLENGELRFHWNNSSSSWGASTGLNFTLNSWSFIAMSVSGNATTLYLNGASKVVSFEHVVEAFDPPFYIGLQSPNWRCTNGIFDQVTIFDRALTATEIDHLYKGSDPVP